MTLNEDQNEDYFDGPDIPDRPDRPKKRREAPLKPDDPRYWEQPEDEYDHLMPAPGHHHHMRLWVWTGISVITVGMLWALFLRVFSPHTEDAVQYGYVESIEKHGDVFKTFEGVMLPYKSLMDTVRPYEGDFRFSVKDPAVAAQLKRMQFSNLPVRVAYETYHTVMPWRGESKNLVVSVDSVSERDILPPDRQPATVARAK